MGVYPPASWSKFPLSLTHLSLPFPLLFFLPSIHSPSLPVFLAPSSLPFSSPPFSPFLSLSPNPSTVDSRGSEERREFSNGV